MKIKNFFHSIEGPRILSIERRIFNITSFYIFLFTMIGLIGNILTGLHLIVIFISFLAGAISFLFFWLSRIKHIRIEILIFLYLLAIIVLLGFMFFFNSGTEGTVPFLILMLLILFVLIAKKRIGYVVNIVVYTLFVALFILEYKYPGWIIRYHSPEEKLVDHIITVLYATVFTTFIILKFKGKLEEDRLEIMQANQKLAILNEEIILQKNELEEKRQSLEKSLSEIKERNGFIETLLRELSHRVKNNLQLVISLLDMQAVETENDIQKAYVQETKNRLTALVLVHQKLYGPETGVAIYMPDYIKELGESIDFFTKTKLSRDSIILYDIAPVNLDIEKVISLGLIINEIITNSFKHAFKNTTEPEIKVAFSHSGDYKLEISDNGCGFTPETATNRTGLSLINSLTKQLGGSLELISGPGSGTTCILKF